MSTVTIYPDFARGDSAHHDSAGDGKPDIAEALRQVAADLLALSGRNTGLQAKVDELVSRQAVLRAKVDSQVGNYNSHRGAGGVHQAADVDTVITAPAATDVTADILTLVNNEAAMLIAHLAQGAAIHPGGADTTNALSATNPATNEAEGALLMTDIKDTYELHRANNGGAWHTNPDATNTIAEADATDWDTAIVLSNAFKNTTGFNAHVALTAGPTHGADGSADLITAPNSGTQKTALELELNEFKTDLNAHIEKDGIHPNLGVVNATAAATTEATSVALLVGLTASGNVHFASGDDHLDADTEAVTGVPTEYEDIIVVVAEWRAALIAHMAKSATHNAADAANAETVTGGSDVAVLGVTAAVTPGLVAG